MLAEIKVNLAREQLGMGKRLKSNEAAFEGFEDEILAIFPHLKKHLGRRAGTLSTGEQQMVSLGRAFMSEPRLSY